MSRQDVAPRRFSQPVHKGLPRTELDARWEADGGSVAEYCSPDSFVQLGKRPKSVDARDILRALKGHSEISGDQANTGRGETSYELEGQVGDWNVDGGSDVPSVIRASQGRAAAGCGVGTVSIDGRGVGNFRLAVCKVEMRKEVLARARGRLFLRAHTNL
jgi:hypothetical protein